MNYRDYKTFAPNTYSHCYNRGIAKQDIFLDNHDYLFFLSRLRENIHPEMVTISPSPGGYLRQLLPPHSFTLISYVLMPNHFHLQIRQDGEVPVGKLVSKVCTSYSKYFNEKYERVGSLFQDTFKAILIDNDSYLTWLSAYIHNNPKVAQITPDLKSYQWSSYLDYLGLRNGTMCDKSIVLDKFKSADDYEQFVNDTTSKIAAMKHLEDYMIDGN